VSKKRVNQNQLIASKAAVRIKNSNKNSQNYRYSNTNRKHVSKHLINENQLIASPGEAEIENSNKK